MIVNKRAFLIPELLLQSGRSLREIEVGYETYGTLNDKGDNAILVCHYFSGTSHAAGRYDAADPEPGYWDSIIGPGKAIDTDRYFVVSSDTLTNANVKMPNVITTGPASIDPDTGRPYGASFPIVTIGDFVNVQKALCSSLGIQHLVAVAGPSMGAMQAYEWAARYPEFIDRVMAVIPPGLVADPYLVQMQEMWAAPIRADRNFNGGEYYGQAEPIDGLKEALKLITYTALHHDWARRLFSGKQGARWADPDRNPLHSLENRFAIDVALEETAHARALVADANSVLRLCRAVQLAGIRDRISNVRARFLIIPSATDLLIPAACAERGAKELRAAGLSVDMFTIEGDGGHLDGLTLISQADAAIRKFLANSTR